MKKFKFIFVLLAMLLVLVSCSTNAESSSKKSIVVAFLPNEVSGGDLKENFKTLLEEIQVALGDKYDVDYVVADDYAAVSTAIRTGTAQLAWESGNTYATSHILDSRVVPIVSYGIDGKKENANYPAYIAVHKDNAKDFAGITDEKAKLELLKDKSFAFVSATSTSGSLFPSTTFYRYFGPDGTKAFETRAQLQTSGVFFSEVQFGGKHQNVVQLLNQKKVYAGAFCCNYGAETNPETGKESSENIEIISTQYVPNGPLWTSTKSLTDEEIKLIQDHLVGLTESNTNSKIFHPTDGLFSAESADQANANKNRFFAVDKTFYDLYYEMNKVK